MIVAGAVEVPCHRASPKGATQAEAPLSTPHGPDHEKTSKCGISILFRLAILLEINSCLYRCKDNPERLWPFRRPYLFWPNWFALVRLLSTTALLRHESLTYPVVESCSRFSAEYHLLGSSESSTYLISTGRRQPIPQSDKWCSFQSRTGASSVELDTIST